MSNLNNGFLFRSLFQNMLNGCGHCEAIYGHNGEMVDYTHLIVNKAWINIIGMDATGRKVSEMFPNLRETNPEVFERYDRVSRGGEPEIFETYVPQLGQWFSIAAFCLEQGTFTALFSDITSQKQEVMTLIEMKKKIESAYEETIHGFLWALRIRDHSSAEHSHRVVEMTERLARRLNISEDDIYQIKRGALLHDIGKLLVHDYILNKPGILTDEERESMRRHTYLAHKLLEPIEFIGPQANDIPWHHHERWDGTGYPDGLKGLDISIGSRIFAIVDNWDALTSDRPYRGAWSDSFTLQYIQNQSGILFDPTMVKEFVNMLDGR